MKSINTGQSPRAAHSITGLAQDYGTSESLWRTKIREGELRAVRVGRRIVVMNADLEKFLAARATRQEYDPQ
jgi:excisionase family DNA binding protein